MAEKRGAIGIILFSDPADYTSGDIDRVYPHDWWLPPSGTQRGTVYIGSGDPLTPGYPSIGTPSVTQSLSIRNMYVFKKVCAIVIIKGV